MTAPPGSSYTVRRWSGLGQIAFEVVPVLGLGIWLGAVRGEVVTGTVMCVVVLVLAAFAADRATLAFRVGPSGVTWSRRVPRVVISRAGVRRLDWASVAALDVVEGETVRAWLRPDAPLPAWMAARVVEVGGDGEVVEGAAPGVEGGRVRNVVNRWIPDVSVRSVTGRTPPGGAESGR